MVATPEAVQTTNAFCPTGPGGGQDNSCSSAGSGGSESGGQPTLKTPTTQSVKKVLSAVGGGLSQKGSTHQTLGTRSRISSGSTSYDMRGFKVQQGFTDKNSVDVSWKTGASFSSSESDKAVKAAEAAKVEFRSQGYEIAHDRGTSFTVRVPKATTNVVLTSNTGARVKRVHHAGRDYLVAPASLIVPGVLNGSDGAGYYPLDEIVKNAKAWDDMPIVVYHPTKNGFPVAAMDPEHTDYVLRESGVGFLRNTRDVGKLASEAWFDEEYLQDYDKKLQPQFRIYPRLLRNESIELSTGLVVHKDFTPGTCPKTGRAYDWVARNHQPDHLAVLPDQRGACSVEDGCGITVNDQVENSNPEGCNQYTGPGCSTGGGGEVGRSGKGLPKQWQDELAKHDKMASDHIRSVVPGMTVREITGDHVQEPRVVGSTEKSFSEVKASLKSAGYKAPSKWNKEDSQTFFHSETGHQITVGKYVGTGGGSSGRHVAFYPTYKMPKLNAETRNSQPSGKLDVTPEKACQIVKEGVANGHELTEAQKGMFGAKCGERATENVEISLPNGIKIQVNDGEIVQATTNEENDMAVAMTPEIRKGLVDRLVTNCRCGDAPDAEVLNKLSDRTLISLNAMPEALAKAKAKKSAAEDAADGGVDDEEENPDGTKKKMTKNQENKQMINNSQAGSPISAKEWLEQAPPEIRGIVINALETEREVKQDCINRLVANVAEKDKEAYTALYNGMDNRALKMLVKALPVTQNSGDLDRLFSPVTYQGSVGGPEGGHRVANVEFDAPEGLPVTNWEEEQVKEERLTRQRREAVEI